MKNTLLVEILIMKHVGIAHDLLMINVNLDIIYLDILYMQNNLKGELYYEN